MWNARPFDVNTVANSQRMLTNSLQPGSKIPRWCPVKLPPIHCKQKGDNKPSKARKSGICKLPSLGEAERKAVWKVKAQRKELNDHLKGTEAHVQYLKQRLKEIQFEIEKIYAQLSSNQEASYEFFEGCDDSTAVGFLPKDNIRLRQDLQENIELEDKLTIELEVAQRELWGAGVADHYLSTEVEGKLEPIISLYEEKMSSMAQKRALREKVMKRNAEKLRIRTLNQVVNSIQSNIESNPRKSQLSLKVNGARNAYKRADHFIRKTMMARRQQKLTEYSDLKLKQDRQQKLLAHLKQEMDDQKDTLIAMSQAKQKKDARIAAEKEQIREHFANSGKNPYYAEHLLAIEEKRAQQHRKVLEKEQQRLNELQREFKVSEKLKKQEETKRKKWDAFWAKKLEERKKALKQKHAEFYEKEEKATETSTNEIPKGYPAPNPTPPPPPPSEASMSRSKIDNDVSVNVTEVGVTKKMSSGSGRSGKSNASSSNRDPSSKLSSSRRKSSNRGGRKSQVQFEDIPSTETLLETADNRNSRYSISKDTMYLFGEDYDDVETMDISSFRSEEYTGESEDDFYESSHRKSKEAGSTGKSNSLRKSSDKGEETIIAQIRMSQKGGGDIIAPPPSPVTAVTKIAKPKYSFLKPIKPQSNAVAKKKNKNEKLAFRWAPNVVTFSDYEVGKTFKKILTVTNISTERVKFFLKDFINIPINPEGDSDDTSKSSITDWVHVNFQVSKTLSPGLTHDVYITFSPPEIRDWKGLLKFESSNLPFEVPIECLKKRFVPVLSSLKAVFTNIVAGTSAMIAIKLQNTGAKVGVISQIEQISGEHPPMNNDPSGVSLRPTATKATQLYGERSGMNELASPRSVTSSLHKGLSRVGTSHHNHTDAHHHHHSHLHMDSHHSIKSSNRDLPDKENEAKKVGGSSQLVRGLLDDLVNSIVSGTFITYVKECNRELEQNASRTIILIFRPAGVDTYKSTFDICFEDPEAPKLTFKAVGASMESPIHLEPKKTDFKICTMDHNYQQLVNVLTTIRGAGKVSVEIPKEMRNFVDVSPKEVTVFAKNPGRFSVKFKPSSAILARDNPAIKYFDPSSMKIEFPVNFHLKFPFKVASPLTASFSAILTNQSLEFIPDEIDMGKCSSIETVQSTFSIFNNCLLPQEIGFVDVPECISIQPNFGFATLLPHETREFDLMLSLPENSRDECVFMLKCQTLQFKSYTLPVRVFAKPNSIQLSETRIFFPVTAVGSVSTTTIDIFSTAPETRHSINPQHRSKFVFNVPAGIPVTVLPKAGFIEPRKPTKIIIRFEAQVSEKEVKDHLLKMLEKDYMDNQAMLQRELAGINETLKYEMVFNEEDFNEGFIKNLKAQNESEEQPELEGTKRQSRKDSTDTDIPEKKERQSSFIKSAPVESNIRLSVDSTHTSQSNHSEPTGQRRKSKRKSQASKTEVNEQNDSKRNSNQSEPMSNRGSTEIEKSKRRKTKKSIRGSVDSDTIPITERRQSTDPKIAFMIETYKALEKRRDSLIKLLEVPYNPPNVDNVDPGSREFSKAKRNLIKHLETSSHTYCIPCFVTDESGDADVHLLIAKCPISHPSLTLLDESNTFDFGAVEQGSRAYREVHLYNISSGTIKLKMDILNPYGPFAPVNALRKIPADHIFCLKLRFQPDEVRNYEDSFRILGGDSRITINLKGSGLASQLNAKPTQTEVYPYDSIEPVDSDEMLSLDFDSVHVEE